MSLLVSPVIQAGLELIFLSALFSRTRAQMYAQRHSFS